METGELDFHDVILLERELGREREAEGGGLARQHLMRGMIKTSIFLATKFIIYIDHISDGEALV